MVDWAGLAAEKYAIMDRETRAKEQQAAAQAAHLNVLSALAPQQTASQIAAEQAKTAALRQEADLRPGESLAEQAYKRAQAGAAGAMGGYHEALAGQLTMPTPATFWEMIGRGRGLTGDVDYSALTGGGGGGGGYQSLTGKPMGSYIRDIGTPAPAPAPAPASAPAPSLFEDTSMSPLVRQRRGFAMGTEEVNGATSKVPGKGDGTVDKVPAKLAPGEAVLNKAAAELVGRDVIAALNQAGADIMGMDSHAVIPGGEKTPKVDPKAEEKGYACGTSKVKKYAAGTEDVPGQMPAMPAGMPSMGEMDMEGPGETTSNMEMVSIPTSILDILIQALRDKGVSKAPSKSKAKSEAKP